MEKVLLEDDMKELRRIPIVTLAIWTLGIISSVYHAYVNEVAKENVIGGVVFYVVVLCLDIYDLLRKTKYKVIVTGEKIIENTIFKSKTLELSGKITYKCKKYFFPYFLFKIIVEDKTIVICVKKDEELKKILQQLGAEEVTKTK